MKNRSKFLITALLVLAMMLSVVGHTEAQLPPPAPPLPIGPLYGVAYPINGGGIFVADQVYGNGTTAEGISNPEWHLTHGWVTATLYFNRFETWKMKTATAINTYLLIVCSALPFGINQIICGLGAAVMGQWAYVATNAYADGKCLKLKLYPYGIPPFASAYSGGYCGGLI